MIRSDFTKSLAIQCRVIGALTLREVLTRYGRKNIGFLWLFIEPMLFTVVISALWNATRDAHGFKLPITAFAVTGYSSVLLWRNMVNRCSGAMSPNIGLLFHRNVKVMDVFSARILLEFIGATAAFIGISLIYISIGLMDLPHDPLKVVMGWMMLAWFGASLALVMGCLSEKSDMVDKIWSPLQFVLFPLSGVAFMVDWMPVQFQEIIMMFPMVHGLELVREGYFGHMVRAHYDLGFLSIVCLSLTFVGLILARETARNLNPS